jgi:low temperature requirement protein LtrA
MTAIGGLALIFAHPEIAAVVILLVTILMALVLWWLWKKIRALRDRLNQPINLGLK